MYFQRVSQVWEEIALAGRLSQAVQGRQSSKASAIQPLAERLATHPIPVASVLNEFRAQLANLQQQGQ